MDKILFYQISQEELNKMMEEAAFNGFQKAIQSQTEERYCSAEKARHLFDPAVSRQTINNWVNQGKLQRYVIGGKKVFKYSELLTAVKTIKRYGR